MDSEGAWTGTLGVGSIGFALDVVAMVFPSVDDVVADPHPVPRAAPQPSSTSGLLLPTSPQPPLAQPLSFAIVDPQSVLFDELASALFVVIGAGGAPQLGIVVPAIAGGGRVGVLEELGTVPQPRREELGNAEVDALALGRGLFQEEKSQ